MSLETNYFYDFDNFRLDYAEKTLRRGETAIPLTPKVFDTLCVLIANAGRLLEKDELMRQIWHDRVVEETNLTFNIKMLRKALGDDAARPRFIETVPRRGYRFIAVVNKIAVAEKIAVEIKPPAKISNSDLRTDRSVRFFFALFAAVVLFAGALTFVSYYAPGNSASGDAPILSAPFFAEKLSNHGKIGVAVISPDGNTVAYRHETGNRQSIWLRHLKTGGNVEIVPLSENIYYGIKFSPDAEFLYFSRRLRDAEGQADIYRIPLSGGVPVKIIAEAQGWMSVAPDGKTLSFVRCYYRDDDYCSLYVADADGGRERKLVSRPSPFRIGDNRISPDGKSIAFAVGQSDNQANEFELRAVNIADGTERELTGQKFFDIKSLAWLPNQRDLLITAARIPNRNFRLWHISADGGAAQLTKDAEDYGAINLNAAGEIVSAIQIKADFNLSIHNLENPSLKRTLTDAANARFAPNGKLYFSSVMSDNQEIWSINADGSEQNQLTNDAGDDSKPLISPDGNFVYFSSNRTGAVQIWRMNADGSNQTQLTATDGGFPIFVTPDGQWLYYLHGLQRNLWRVSFDGGKPELIFNERKYAFAVSPDGSQIAMADKRGGENFLKIVSLADKQIAKTFPAPDGKIKITEIEWLADGANLVYVVTNGFYESNVMWRQPINGEPARQIADLGELQVASLSFAPDAKTFAVVQGKWNSDAVLLRGLK